MTPLLVAHTGSGCQGLLRFMFNLSSNQDKQPATTRSAAFITDPHQAVVKAVNELTHRSLRLVSHSSESDMIFFPWLRVKIKKLMTDLWRFSKIPKIKMGTDMKVLKRKGPKMVVPGEGNFLFGKVPKHL